jgi:hypothetical protein
MNGATVAANGLIGFADPTQRSIVLPDNTGDNAPHGSPFV